MIDLKIILNKLIVIILLTIYLDMVIKVGIIDYSVSNLNSVYNAFGRIGVSAEIFNNPEDFGSYSHLILPGVGSFPKEWKI